MRARPLLVMTLLAATALAAVPSTAGAASGHPRSSGRFLTIAARSCSSYTDVTANRARNNIQESLKDLGRDTLYRAGEPISPAKEDLGQPACEPLPDWTFTLGTGIKGAVTGPWGSLSVVSGAFSGPPVTKDATPLLDTNGHPTGRTIAGAVTIELTQSQANLAARPSSLWIQGGTVADPILNQRYPGVYGFAALRCAIDNLNGDNVEWVSYPQGAEHVFCYAYYVKPPPTSGTIIVRKVADAPAGTARQDFRFEGNISYTPDGSFVVSASPGSDGTARFYRAQVGGTGGAAAPWEFTEQVPPGWRLTGLACVSQSGTSATSTNLQTGRSEVTLAAGDTVTCTYTNTFVPPPAGLQLAKVTFGNVGRFGWNVAGPDTATATATTTEREVETPADPATLSLTPGDYTIEENFLPISASGTWALTGVRCNGQEVTAFKPVRLTLASGQGQLCVFENTFTPAGSIKVRKLTRGAVGTTGFVITPVDTPSKSFEQRATTRQEGVAVLATGDPTTRLPLGRYVIQETTPTEPTEGVWSLDSLTCNGEPVPTAQGAAEIQLTKEAPSVDCTFADRFDRGAVEPGGGGGGGDTGGSGEPVNPITNLAVTKSVQPKVVDAGERATYTIVVRNRSRQPAEEVTVAEQPNGRVTAVALTTSKGTCVPTNPAVCRIGTVRPGEQVVVHATVRPERVVRFRNVVAVNTATAETELDDNRAATTLRVRPRPRFTG